MDISNYSSSRRRLLKIRLLNLFRAERFTYNDSDIYMVDSDAAETFSAVDDKLHLLIQSDSSATS